MTTLRVLAPGSMTHLMPRLVRLYQESHPAVVVESQFGPSGSLRDKIESGTRFDLYLTASTTHTDALRANGFVEETALLGFNEMVLLYQRPLAITPDQVIAHLVDPDMSVGMSTTGLDPSGDYAIEILEKVSQVSGVSLEIITEKTRMVTGGRETPNAPPGRNQYGWLMENEDIDVLLTYLSNALAAIDDNAHINFTPLPESIAVTGTYGIGLKTDASEEAKTFFDWLVDMDAQKILKDGGFIPVHERA